MKYRKEIDGLRALAILPVLLFHAGFETFSGGFVGVDIFFVISGYLITRIILDEMLAGTFSITRFYERRIRRIAPVLTLILLISGTVGWFLLLPRDMKSFSESLVSVLFFISNIYFKRSSGYFDEASELKPLLHTWSLGVEEQYYLLFPLLMLFALRRSHQFLVKVLVILCLLSLALSQWAALAKPVSAFYLLWARLWELLVGALLAIHLSQSKELPTPRIAAWGSWLGLLLIAYATFTFDRQTIFPGINALLPTLGAACIIMFASEKNPVGILLSTKPLVTLGLISYSAYLWHQPIYAFVKHAVDYELTPIIYGTLIASTLGLSLLTWRYVEQPFRSRSGISFKRVIFWWVLADVLLLGYGLVGKWTEGLPHRPNLMERHPETVGHADFYQALSTFPVCLPDRVAKSTVVYEQITRCRQSKPNSLPTVVLVGDSHAEHLFFGFSEQLKTENVAVYLNRTYPFSREADFAEINDYVLSSSSIHTVVIGVQWKRWFDDRPSDVSLHEALLQTVRPWLKNGKRVYLMGDIPMFPFSAERCKYKLKYAIDDICTVAAAKVITQQKEFMHELERVIEDLPQVELLMVRELFCKDALCSMTPANALMYRDESHLNMEGSRYVIEELTKKHPSLKSK